MTKSSCGSGVRRALSLVWMVAALVMALTVSARAQEKARARTIGQKLMCVCGCNQILTACNHIGCTISHDMLKELDARVARGDSDDLILQSFVQEYGPNVLAEPPAKGFNWIAWITPVLVPLVALFLVSEVVRRWRRRPAASPGPGVSPELLARAQREAREEDNERR
jgi:cytochrome c-type biogenesis protein CcmH/NrfF